jgi:hypothetical protein
VTSVLAMMFLVLFGSLAAAMAIASRGNIRAASTHLNIMRSMGAAETGLDVAEARLQEAVSRFVIEKGTVDPAFGNRLWLGTTTAGDGVIEVLPPFGGYNEFSLPSGVAEAVANIHAADINIAEQVGVMVPTITSAPVGADLSVYMADGWVITPAVSLQAHPVGQPSPVAFQAIYAPLVSGTEVRIIVTGFEFDHIRGEVPITRTVSRDYKIIKRIDAAVVSSSPVMFGPNVMIEGDIGAIYSDVDEENGHPLQLRSDFHGLDDVLDAKLDDLFTQLETYDIDGDNRLRVGHPVEAQGLYDGGGQAYDNKDYDGDGSPDGAFGDITQDGYLDEFDIFLSHFDANGDKKITLSADLTLGTPAEGMTPEFVDADGELLNEDLSRLMDTAYPDRNENGVWGFNDTDNDGFWDIGSESLDDYDDVTGTYPDHVLGWRDGFIDKKDQYAKVKGRLAFRVVAQDWADAQGAINQYLQGPIDPKFGQPPLTFGAGEAALPDVSADTFTGSQTALHDAADGDPFWDQLAVQLGVGVGDLDTYEQVPVPPGTPEYYRLDSDLNMDGLPDNFLTAYFEKMPFNSPALSDWYYRPVIKNCVFKDVVIPMGLNALFVDCTFVGVTRVETYQDNLHVNWTLYGKMYLDSSTGRPALDPTRYIYGDDAGEDEFPEMLDPADVPVLMATTPLDKADIPADMVPLTQGYDDMPDPLIIDGFRVIDTKLWSNNLRFHDCLFVGSIVSDTPSEFTHVRNKMQFTGATRFVTVHPDDPNNADLNPDPGDDAEIDKSSMMLPNYSVDIGTFNSPPEQDVRLHGVVVAGILDIRGNASIEGALLLTYLPVKGQGPLVDPLGNPIGNPANFNTTIGYFGPEDGDKESVNPKDLPLYNDVPIVGWDLDGDGIADLNWDETPTQQQIDDGATPVPFNGYGRVSIRFDPNMTMPDGLMLPLQIDGEPITYQEGMPF